MVNVFIYGSLALSSRKVRKRIKGEFKCFKNLYIKVKYGDLRRIDEKLQEEIYFDFVNNPKGIFIFMLEDDYYHRDMVGTLETAASIMDFIENADDFKGLLIWNNFLPFKSECIHTKFYGLENYVLLHNEIRKLARRRTKTVYADPYRIAQSYGFKFKEVETCYDHRNLFNNDGEIFVSFVLIKEIKASLVRLTYITKEKIREV
jgi:hypothetical protein